MDQYLDKLDRFSINLATQSLKAYKLYVKVLGTDVTITRVSVPHNSRADRSMADTDRYHRLLKAAMTVTDAKANHSVEKFTYRILINRSVMANRYRRQDDDITIDVTEDVFMPGDMVSYKYHGITYRFKVGADIQSFGLEGDEVYFKIPLIPYRESR